MILVAYEYKSACGSTIRKAVLCKTFDESRRVVGRIKESGYTLLEFDEVMMSKDIPWCP